MNIEKIFEILESIDIELSADIILILMVDLLYRARKERYSVVVKYINISYFHTWILIIEKIFEIQRNI